MNKVGLISAMRCEIPDLITYGKSKRVQNFKLEDYDIGVILSGIGPEKAANATKILCSEFNPDYIIFLGFCGAAQKGINMGDLVVADKIHYNGNEISLKSSQLKDVKRCLSTHTIPHHIGKLQTFDHPVLSKKEVLDDAIGVDMESYIIFQKAREHNIPSVIIRSVSDIIPERKPFLFPTI
jgi:adenosylhomocysteine nucleosidase